MAVAICPACGYPTIGPELCAFCRPVKMLKADESFEPGAYRTPAASWLGVGGMRYAS